MGDSLFSSTQRHSVDIQLQRVPPLCLFAPAELDDIFGNTHQDFYVRQGMSVITSWHCIHTQVVDERLPCSIRRNLLIQLIRQQSDCAWAETQCACRRRLTVLLDSLDQRAVECCVCLQPKPESAQSRSITLPTRACVSLPDVTALSTFSIARRIVRS